MLLLATCPSRIRRFLSCATTPLLIGATLGLGLLTATAGATPADPPDLGRAVPGEAFLFVHGKHNPERAFLDAHMEELWTAFKNSGVIEAVSDIISSNIPEGERGEMTMVIDQVKRFGGMIDWLGLVENEVGFGMCMRFPTPAYIIATRPKAEKYPELMKGLGNILAEIQKFQPEAFHLETGEREGFQLHALSFGPEVPAELCVAGKDGTILISTSVEDMRKSIDLYTGKQQGSILDHEWFKEGSRRLPAYEDSFTFFNLDALLDGYETMLSSVIRIGGEDEEKKAILDVVRAGLDQVRMIKYVVASEKTEGNLVVAESYTRYADNLSSLPLSKAFFQQGTFSDYHKYVPKDATSFSLSGGMKPVALYDAVAAFIGEKVPNGKGLLDMWAAKQSELGIDVREDFLSWISGESISFTLPSSGGAAMGGMSMGGDSVTMIRVNDVAKGKKVIDNGLNAANQWLKNVGQSLIIMPAADAGEGFKTVTHPFMMAFFKPVIGFEGDYLVIATSGNALKSLRDVREGKAPSILENSKFTALNLGAEGTVSSIGYTDMSKTYEEMSQAMAMIPMFMGMALQGNDPKMKVVRDLVNVLPLLSPVIQKLDFHLAMSSYTKEEKGGRYQKVVNAYRKDEKATKKKDA